MVPVSAFQPVSAGRRDRLIPREVPETSWPQALNAPIYLVSILPGVGVWQLVRPSGNALTSLVAATLAVVLVQHAINVLNDVADWRLGADVEKHDSWIRAHRGEVAAGLRHGWLSLAVGGLLGVLTLFAIGRLWILAIALPLVALGYLYNSGTRPLSYTSFGEWVTGVCYGPGVFGCLWLVTGEVVSRATWLGCVAFAALAVALLLAHQPPQIRTDRNANKRSFAVRHGPDRTYQAVRALFLLFLTCWGLALAELPGTAGSLVFFLPLSGFALIGCLTEKLGPKYLLIWATGLLAAQIGEILAPIGLARLF